MATTDQPVDSNEDGKGDKMVDGTTVGGSVPITLTITPATFTDMKDLQKGMLLEANDKFGKWYVQDRAIASVNCFILSLVLS